MKLHCINGNFAVMNSNRYIKTSVMATILTVILAAADLLWGGSLGLSGVHVIWKLRAPRVLTAILAGSSLALAGTQMQSILRNPLADPHIMGVSSGASLGAAIATMLGGSLTGIFHGVSVTLAAFAGALASASVILAVSRRFASSTTLLIFGVMLGFIVNAVVSILQFSSDAESLKTFYSWSAGSFSHTTMPQIAVIGIVLAIGFMLAFRERKGLDIILFGDEYARMSGADTGKIRVTAILSCCLVTAAVTAFCGPLGFAGIVAPHIARAMTGTSSHRVILPVSLLTGSVITLGADLISQLSPAPLPVSGTMALIGIPVILYILLKKP